MAKQTDALALNQRRQKIILAVGGVVLAALLAIQGPKLWNQLNGSGAAAPATTTETTAGTPVTPTTSVPAPTASGSTAATPVAGKGSAVLVGVPVTPTGKPEAEEGQLWSFSRFEAKDPFEQNVSTETESGSSGGSDGSGPGVKPAPEKAATAAITATTGTSVAGSPGVAPTPESGVTHATIAVNGKPEQLTAKDVFPKVDKTFVLVGLKEGVAKIGVAGGSFTEGGTVSLRLGKQVTLVDTATGARYVLKLLYLGAGPEQIESFTGSKDT